MQRAEAAVVVVLPPEPVVTPACEKGCGRLARCLIFNDRDKLPPGEWVIRLLVGADDGGASRHDVHIAWSADAPDYRTVLAEALVRLEVVPV